MSEISPRNSPRNTPCRSCGAPIFFGITHSGKAIPLNAKPEKRFVLQPTTDGGFQVALLETYSTHFEDCPNAREHRKAGAT